MIYIYIYNFISLYILIDILEVFDINDIISLILFCVLAIE